MEPIPYLMMIAAIVAFAGFFDGLWLVRIRPPLARRFGWRWADPTDRIPHSAAVGASVFFIALFIAVPYIGTASGM